MTDEKVLAAHVDEFIRLIKDTRKYQDYVHMCEVLAAEPEISEKVREFRRENYFLQHAPENEDIYDRVAELRLRNEELLSRPEVYDYLMAEWEFFRLVQELFDRIMERMDF
ncbi:MAG: YlbF family regulator [Lachnospiraceae bacterium]|nr:YlbF family regulator [Lachnospiraceae bacterium]